MAFYPDEVRDRLRQAMDDARFRGKPWDLEVAMIPASGHRLFVRSVGEAEFNEQGVPVRLVGTVQDVTDRKRLEHKVEANERFIRNIADNIPVRLAYVNRDKRFQFVNRALFDRMQTTREALMGRSLGEFASPKHREAGSRRVAAVLEGLAQRYEYDDHVEGEFRRIETQLIPDRGEVGEVRGFFAIGIDITHLKDVERKLRELTEVFDNTSDFVSQTDSQGNVLYVNRSGRRALDLEEDEAVEGRDFRDFTTKDTVRQFARDIIPTVKECGVWVGESEILLNGGRVLPVSHIAIGHFDAEGRISRYSSLMRDISVEVAARGELSRQTATLNTVLEAIPAMVAVFDRDMRYMLVNRAFERWRGSRREDLIGRHAKETMDSAELAVSEPWMQRALAGETVSYEKDYPGASQSKHMSVAYMPLRLNDGSIAGLIAVAHDITRHREENIRLLLLSERDPLTGLLNRAGFEHYMDAKIRQGDGGSVSVIYADLDHFKPVNDTLGHAAGDQLLREFASRLQHLVRPTDAVARLGGDEFVIVLSGVRDVGAAARVAEKVVAQAKEPMHLDGHSVAVSASVGVAFDAEAAGGWKALVDRADQMVYRAKAQGRGRAVIAAEPDALPVRQANSS
jgi:diguanylate cyclase (GGDEF)-like protein/PAS domain S-box-containing protein